MGIGFPNCTKKELKVIAQKIEYVGVVKEWQKTRNFIHFVYLCTNWTGNIQVCEPNKCEAWEWFDIHKLPKKILAGHKYAIQLIDTSSKSQSNRDRMIDV